MKFLIVFIVCLVVGNVLVNRLQRRRYVLYT